MVPVPLRYPLDHFTVLARGLGLKKQDMPIWAMRADGVLAIDRALTLSRPSTVRILSVGGPAVDGPVHVKAVPGYPIQRIIDPRVSSRPVRIISGGVMTGSRLPDNQLGLDVECNGLTVLPERQNREFLGFLRPGYDRRSFSRCFLSSLRHGVAERLDTALRGERRPCISCVACEEVCPVSIMPHLIHKYLHQDLLEEAEWTGVKRCIGCGLCSYVCPAKIELRAQLTEACDRLRTELQTGKVTR
jgi:Na+-transporting NADH:ubiquinone oxidoreductase subunit A